MFLLAHGFKEILKHMQETVQCYRTLSLKFYGLSVDIEVKESNSSANRRLF